MPRLDASSAARNSTTDVIPQISLPKHWNRYYEKMIGIPGKLESTLDNFAPGCLFEKLSLGYYGLPSGPLANGDFDHRRRGSGETRMR